MKYKKENINNMMLKDVLIVGEVVSGEVLIVDYNCGGLVKEDGWYMVKEDGSVEEVEGE